MIHSTPTYKVFSKYGLVSETHLKVCMFELFFEARISKVFIFGLTYEAATYKGLYTSFDFLGTRTKFVNKI